MTRRAPRIRTALAATLVALATLPATTGGDIGSIKGDELREWLTYIASDELGGRALHSSGLGLAAAYIERHLRQWGAKPAGDAGTSYLQAVPIHGLKTTNRSTVTVQVGGRSRTFADGEGVLFPRFVGGKRRIVIERVEFAGYGLDAPRTGHVDFAGKDMTGAAVIWLGTRGPRVMNGSSSRGLLNGRNRYATEELRAEAVIGPEGSRPGGGRAGGGGGGTGTGGGRQLPAADFTTSERLDVAVTPVVSASDAFFELLFSRAPTAYAELKERANAQEPLPSFRLENVSLIFNIDADYEIVRTQITHNVAAIVEGSDPQLKSTYVAFGAHYDHVGYAEGEVVESGGTLRREGPTPGFVKAGAERDRIWNGADDDGSGTVGLMGMIKAFMEGPRPRRSLLFVWHAGEEIGRYGSLYFADHPTVPLESIVAQLNVDMIGRNRDDKASEANTAYLVGADRISSELDAISRAANDAMPRPMALSYELNDPSDSEQLYYRSDHYSYAAKGIPVIFFTTGLHPDYHANTDEVDRIDFDKMTRVAQLIYETGRRLADLDHFPVRDHKGARAQ
jgi:peptidase M28-like protein